MSSKLLLLLTIYRLHLITLVNTKGWQSLKVKVCINLCRTIWILSFWNYYPIYLGILNIRISYLSSGRRRITLLMLKIVLLIIMTRAVLGKMNFTLVYLKDHSLINRCFFVLIWGIVANFWNGFRVLTLALGVNNRLMNRKLILFARLVKLSLRVIILRLSLIESRWS